MGLDPSSDYPLGSSRPDLVRTPGGIPLDELTLHGEGVTAAELRATSVIVIGGCGLAGRGQSLVH